MRSRTQRVREQVARRRGPLAPFCAMWLVWPGPYIRPHGGYIRPESKTFVFGKLWASLGKFWGVFWPVLAVWAGFGPESKISAPMSGYTGPCDVQNQGASTQSRSFGPLVCGCALILPKTGGPGPTHTSFMALIGANSAHLLECGGSFKQVGILGVAGPLPEAPGTALGADVALVRRRPIHKSHRCPYPNCTSGQNQN